MDRQIVAFRQDDVGDWVAVLACGHGQHVRHTPPLFERPWVLHPAAPLSLATPWTAASATAMIFTP